MNVCILGATGFIGGQIARAALAEGWAVRAARRNPASTGALGDAQVEWVRADLADAGSLTAAMQGCEIVFHAAASYPEDFRHIDAAVSDARAEMARVLAAARDAGVRRMVYTSTLTTVATRHAAERPATEEDYYEPGSARSAYYEAKFAMEQMALQARDLEVVALLPTAVFGPGDIKPTTGIVIREAARGRIPVYFDGVINAVDGRDVARSHITAALSGRTGERYNLGGHDLTIYELLSTVARVAGRAPPRIKLSRGLLAGLLRTGDALPFVNLPDHIRMFEFWGPVSSVKAERELGHTARPFEETVRDTVAWFGI